MRQNLLVVAVLAILIVATVFVTQHERDTPMDALMQELEAHVVAGEWEEARRSLARLTDQWNRGRLWLSIGNAGQDMDQFERSLSQAGVYLDVEDRTEALAGIAELKSIWNRLERS